MKIEGHGELSKLVIIIVIVLAIFIVMLIIIIIVVKKRIARERPSIDNGEPSIRLTTGDVNENEDVSSV